MTSDILGSLANLAWSVSAAMALVLALRVVLRRLFGAALAYQAWLVVPALALAAFVPALPVQRVTAVAALPHFSAAALPALREGSIQWSYFLLPLWIAGALILAACFGRAHLAFVRRLGPVTQREAVFVSQWAGAGPALLGLWRPKVIVPSDFLTRYTPAEQRLIILHEQVHARRGDPLVNLLQASLQCVLWFNPLVHVAAIAFRRDQELACDAAVTRDHPGQLRAYAQALLKSQMFPPPASPGAVACHWQSNHPVKERIMSLQQAQPSSARRLAGRFAITSLIFAAGCGALLARAGNAPLPGATTYDVAFTLDVPSENPALVSVVADAFVMPNGGSPRVRVRAGESFAVSTEQGGHKWTARFTIAKAGNADSVIMKGRIDSDSTLMAQPTLMGRLGERVGLTVGNEASTSFGLAMVVTEVATGVAQP